MPHEPQAQDRISTEPLSTYTEDPDILHFQAPVGPPLPLYYYIYMNPSREPALLGSPAWLGSTRARARAARTPLRRVSTCAPRVHGHAGIGREAIQGGLVTPRDPCAHPRSPERAPVDPAPHETDEWAQPTGGPVREATEGGG